MTHTFLCNHIRCWVCVFTKSQLNYDRFFLLFSTYHIFTCQIMYFIFPVEHTNNAVSCKRIIISLHRNHASSSHLYHPYTPL